MSQSYWPSAWPAERVSSVPNQAAMTTLAIGPTDRLEATTCPTDHHPVMLVQRHHHELYLYAVARSGAAVVDRIDPQTLRRIVSSGPLDGSCPAELVPGSLAAHSNGDLYVAHGTAIHRLGADCRPKAARSLPSKYLATSDGLVILPDGNLAAKLLISADRVPQPAQIIVLSPDLEPLDTAVLPEPSWAPLSIGPAPDSEWAIYVSGSTQVFRYRWDGSELANDEDWQPTVRAEPSEQTDQTDPDPNRLISRPTISHDRAWVFDGWTPTVVDRPADPMQPARWTNPVRLLGFAIDQPDEVMELLPTEHPAGWVTASPLAEGGVVFGWDTGNTGLAAFDVSPGADREMLWLQPFRTAMQPLLLTETDEVVVTDFRYLDDGRTSDDVVVVDTRTGQMKARVGTGATHYGALHPCPGWDRDLYYCNPAAMTLAHIRVESL